MKKSILALLAVLSISSSYACSTYEALVIGGVEKTVKIAGECYLQIEVDEISEHALCPLARVDIESSLVKDPSCEYKAEDAFSGILVQDDKDYLTID